MLVLWMLASRALAVGTVDACNCDAGATLYRVPVRSIGVAVEVARRRWQLTGWMFPSRFVSVERTMNIVLCAEQVGCALEVYLAIPWFFPVSSGMYEGFARRICFVWRFPFHTRHWHRGRS